MSDDYSSLILLKWILFAVISPSLFFLLNPPFRGPFLSTPPSSSPPFPSSSSSTPLSVALSYLPLRLPPLPFPLLPPQLPFPWPSPTYPSVFLPSLSLFFLLDSPFRGPLLPTPPSSSPPPPSSSLSFLPPFSLPSHRYALAYQVEKRQGGAITSPPGSSLARGKHTPLGDLCGRQTL